MNLYAHINEVNIVVNLVVGDAIVPSDCTAIEYWEDGGLRKNPASIGSFYHAGMDVFVSLSPNPSWVLDANANWQPPIPKPIDEHVYSWDESNVEWHRHNPNPSHSANTHS